MAPAARDPRPEAPRCRGPTTKRCAELAATKEQRSGRSAGPRVETAEGSAQRRRRRHQRGGGTGNRDGGGKARGEVPRPPSGKAVYPEASAMAVPNRDACSGNATTTTVASEDVRTCSTV